MSGGYVSPYDTSQHRLRLFAVCSISALVEVLRYSAHPEQYVGLLQLAALFGPAVNCIFHHWNMPDSVTKASISAFLSEPSIPLLISTGSELALNVSAAVWTFINANIGGLT